MKRGDFPTQDKCDPKKPDEFAAWALVALPNVKGAALVVNSEMMQKISQHLWDCGFRYHRKYQKKWWVPPGNGDPHWLTSPGRWLNKKTEPDPVNMISVLEAMKKADEGGFLDALDRINEAGKK